MIRALPVDARRAGRQRRAGASRVCARAHAAGRASRTVRARPSLPPAPSQSSPCLSSRRRRCRPSSPRRGQEGTLSLVWGQGSMGGSEGVSRLADGFNRAYGLSLDVRFTPGPSMPNMAARVADEDQPGARRRAT